MSHRARFPIGARVVLHSELRRAGVKGPLEGVVMGYTKRKSVGFGVHGAKGHGINVQVPGHKSVLTIGQDWLTVEPKRNPYSRAKYHHHRVRSPRRFTPGSLRTVRAGRSRVVLGHLKGERRRTRRGRRRQTVQAVLTPKRNARIKRARYFELDHGFYGISTGLAREISGGMLPRHGHEKLVRAPHDFHGSKRGFVWLQQTQHAGRPMWSIRDSGDWILEAGRARMQSNRRRVRRNPLLAVAGANPRGRGRFMGYVVQIRYKRTVGEYPGWYKHDFKASSRAKLYAMPDGSLCVTA